MVISFYMPSQWLDPIIVIINIILIKLSSSLMREEVEPSECPVIENQRIGAGFQGWSNIIIIIIIRSTITVTNIIISTIVISINIVVVVNITIIVIIIIIIVTADRDSSLPRRLPSWPNRPPSTRRHGYYDLDLSFIMIM